MLAGRRQAGRQGGWRVGDRCGKEMGDLLAVASTVGRPCPFARRGALTRSGALARATGDGRSKGWLGGRKASKGRRARVSVERNGRSPRRRSTGAREEVPAISAAHDDELAGQLHAHSFPRSVRGVWPGMPAGRDWPASAARWSTSCAETRRRDGRRRTPAQQQPRASLGPASTDPLARGSKMTSMRAQPPGRDRPHAPRASPVRVEPAQVLLRRLAGSAGDEALPPAPHPAGGPAQAGSRRQPGSPFDPHPTPVLPSSNPFHSCPACPASSSLSSRPSSPSSSWSSASRPRRPSSS